MKQYMVIQVPKAKYRATWGTVVAVVEAKSAKEAQAFALGFAAFSVDQEAKQYFTSIYALPVVNNMVEVI